MPRELVFSLDGEVSHLPMSKIDRKKLHGETKRLVVDAADQVCQYGLLSPDGQTLVPAKGYKRPYLDEAGNQVASKDILTVDSDGDVMDVLPSTLGAECELYQVQASRLLDCNTESVYLLGDEQVGAELTAALDAGQIFETEFRYRPSAETKTLFLLRNDAGTFALIAKEVSMSMTVPEAGMVVDEEDDDDDDDLDFSW